MLNPVLPAPRRRIQTARNAVDVILNARSAADLRLYEWEDRGKTPSGKTKWYDTETKKTRYQISKPGTGRGKKAQGDATAAPGEGEQPAAKQPARKKQAAPRKPKKDHNEVGDRIEKMLGSDFPDQDVGALREELLSLTVAQLGELKKRFGVKGGRTKADIAGRIGGNVEGKRKPTEQTPPASAMGSDKPRQKPLKLTDKTKYVVDGDVATIFAKKRGSDKWEPAFSANPATISFIKKNGLQKAFEQGLLTPHSDVEQPATSQPGEPQQAQVDSLQEEHDELVGKFGTNPYGGKDAMGLIGRMKSTRAENGRLLMADYKAGEDYILQNGGKLVSNPARGGRPVYDVDLPDGSGVRFVWNDGGVEKRDSRGKVISGPAFAGWQMQAQGARKAQQAAAPGAAPAPEKPARKPRAVKQPVRQPEPMPEPEPESMDLLDDGGSGDMLGGDESMDLADESPAPVQQPAPAPTGRQAGTLDEAHAQRQAEHAPSPAQKQAASRAIFEAAGNEPVVDISELRSKMPRHLQGRAFDDAVIDLLDSQEAVASQDMNSMNAKPGHIRDGGSVLSTLSLNRKSQPSAQPAPTPGSPVHEPPRLPGPQPAPRTPNAVTRNRLTAGVKPSVLPAGKPQAKRTGRGILSARNPVDVVLHARSPRQARPLLYAWVQTRSKRTGKPVWVNTDNPKDRRYQDAMPKMRATQSVQSVSPAEHLRQILEAPYKVADYYLTSLQTRLRRMRPGALAALQMEFNTEG